MNLLLKYRQREIEETFDRMADLVETGQIAVTRVPGQSGVWLGIAKPADLTEEELFASLTPDDVRRIREENVRGLSLDVEDKNKL
jgi:hypothetical protein